MLLWPHRILAGAKLTMQYDIHMSSRGGGTATADEGDIIIPVDVDRSPKPKHRKPPVTVSGRVLAQPQSPLLH